MEHIFKRGEQVIYHYKEWRQVLWSDSGWGWVSVWKRAVILTQPRDITTGRYTTDYYYDDEVEVRLRDEDGKEFNATIRDIEQDRDITSLSTDELMMLFGQIRRGSMHYSDYRNTLGVFENVAYDFYEGFWEYLVDEYGSEEEADKHDNAVEFAIIARAWRVRPAWRREN